MDADPELLERFDALVTSLGFKTRVETFRELVNRMSAIEELTRGGKKVTLQVLHRTLIVTPQ